MYYDFNYNKTIASYSTFLNILPLDWTSSSSASISLVPTHFFSPCFLVIHPITFSSVSMFSRSRVMCISLGGSTLLYVILCSSFLMGRALILREAFLFSQGRWSTRYTGNVNRSYRYEIALIALTALITQKLSISLHRKTQCYEICISFFLHVSALRNLLLIKSLLYKQRSFKKSFVINADR